MKEKIKMIVVFGLGILVSSGVVYAATLYTATEVSYDNTSSGGSKTNVQGALDELYEKASSLTMDSCFTSVAEPYLGSGLIPITLSETGIVHYADITQEWYNYCEKKWANAVILVEHPSQTYEVGNTINEADIKAYFVWIPKYKYRLWNVNVTNPSKLAHSIEVVFDQKDTIDVEGESCKTPMGSGERGNCDNGEYMTHPAFLSMGVDGIWVGKFETTGSVSAITIKPNVTSLRNINIYNMFVSGYQYSRDHNSHMMKNTEWGAVTYLSHSKYGIDREININNDSNDLTGRSSLLTLSQRTYPGTSGTGGNYNVSYDTEVGVLASTTGNITGIYDMSGGSWEHMAAYRSGTFGSSGFTATTIGNYDLKYFDIYSSNSAISGYQYRILGDATGEMGSFFTYNDGDGYSRSHNHWYADRSDFVSSSGPWFLRGGGYDTGAIGGQFSFASYSGEARVYYTFRIVLTE